MSFKVENPTDLAKATAAVAGWTEQTPSGPDEDLTARVGHHFHRDCRVTLRAVLCTFDRHRALQITGVTLERFW